MDCKKDVNKSNCNCSYPCSRKGICCDCIAYHRKRGELPACYFPDDIDIKEDGEEFDEFFKLPFNISEKQLPSTFSHKMTEAAPLVYYDNSVDIVIEGNCAHSEPWGYFHPLILWLEMLRYNEPEAFSFNVDFFIYTIDENNLNYLTHIIHLLKLIGDKCQSIFITWKYKNDTIKRLGEEQLVDCKLNHMFKFI